MTFEEQHHKCYLSFMKIYEHEIKKSVTDKELLLGLSSYMIHKTYENIIKEILETEDLQSLGMCTQCDEHIAGKEQAIIDVMVKDWYEGYGKNNEKNLCTEG